MKRNYANLAGSLLSLAILAGCTPTSLVATPDMVLESAVPPATLAPCVTERLAQNMRDTRPKLVSYRGIHEISITSPRGDLLAFLTVEPDWSSGSIVSYYNGDLYWPDRTASGMFPDVARDNWHRAENAFLACQEPMAARPAAAHPIAPTPPAVPVSQVSPAPAPKPLASQSLAPLQLGPTDIEP
jgi:hypothetical protein